MMFDEIPVQPGPSRPAREPYQPRRLIAAGSALATLGFALVLFSLVAFNFTHRWDGRVSVTGQVTDTFAAPGQQLNKIDYQIGSNKHVGVLVGSYEVGDAVVVDVPEDGSVYDVLYLSDSVATKVAGHLTMYAGLPILILGCYWMSIGLIRRNRQISADVATRYALMLQTMFPQPPAQAPQQTPDQSPTHSTAAHYPASQDRAQPQSQPPLPPPEQRTPEGYFNAPYDL